MRIRVSSFWSMDDKSMTRVLARLSLAVAALCLWMKPVLAAVIETPAAAIEIARAMVGEGDAKRKVISATAQRFSEPRNDWFLLSDERRARLFNALAGRAFWVVDIMVESAGGPLRSVIFLDATTGKQIFWWLD